MTNYLNQDLRTALEKKDYKAFRQALFSGADPNLKEGEYDLTIAMLAVVEGDVMALKILLEHGVDLDIKNKNGETALDIAKMIKSVNEKKGRPTSQIDEIIQLLQDEKKIQTISLQEMDYSIPGFPSKVGILQMEADVISGAQVYNLSRDRWAMDVGFHYFPDGEQRDAFFETFRNGTIDREMEVYKKAVPSADLFRHFRERTLKALAEKDNLTDAEKKVQRILSARDRDGFRYVYQVNSFYDFAMKTGVLTTKAQETPMHDEDDALAVKKINELNRTKIETAFAMHYYMDALGSSGLPQPKFQGYGTFKKHAAGLVRQVNPDIEDVIKDLVPEGVAYDYLFHLISHSHRWGDISNYMQQTDSVSWLDAEPFVYTSVPSLISQKTGEATDAVNTIYGRMQRIDLGLQAINSYENAYQSTGERIPYFSLGDNRINDNIYKKGSSTTTIENASMQGQNSVADFSGNVNTAHLISGLTMSWVPSGFAGTKAAQGIATAYRAGRVALSTRYAVAGGTVGAAGGPVVAVAGAAAGFVVGYVVDELVLEAIEPVFTYIKATRFDDAYAQCQKINTRVEMEIENLSTKFQELSPYMDALTQEERQTIETNLQKRRKDMETALQEALSKGFESMKNEDKALYEKFTSSEYGPGLRAEMEKMAQNYVQQEFERLKFATYATLLNEKQKQQIQRENPEQFNQMVAMAQTTNSAPTDADVHQFLSSRTIGQSDPFGMGFIQSNHDLLRHEGYGYTLIDTQKALLGDESVGKRHEDFLLQPILGKSYFEQFRAQEVTLLKIKEEQGVITKEEQQQLSILCDEKIKSFSDYHQAYRKVNKNIPSFRVYPLSIYDGAGIQEAVYMYAQGKSAIGLRDGLKIFPNRVDVVRQARTLGVTDYQLAAQFLAEKDVCLQLINGLSKAPDFAIVCQKNGWVGKDGKPDLSMIDGKNVVEPQPSARVSGVRLRVKEDKKPQTAWDVMIEADQAQTRLETLLQAFENHRSLSKQIFEMQYEGKSIEEIVETEILNNNIPMTKEQTLFQSLNLLIKNEQDPQKKQQYMLLKKYALNSDLLRAVQEHDLDKIKETIAQGADINAVHIVMHEDGQQDAVSPLAVAIEFGYTDVVKMLVSNGANIDRAWVDGLRAYLDAEDTSLTDKEKYQQILQCLENPVQMVQPNVSSKIGVNAQAVGEGMPRPPAEKER